MGKVKKSEEDSGLSQTLRRTRLGVSGKFAAIHRSTLQTRVASLARWPSETSTAHNMNVQMEDSLTAMSTGVDDGSISTIKTQ